MIQLQDVTKTYNTGKSNAYTAVRAVSHRISPQSVTVFNGPSGSGKTTLLSLIGCMVRPTAGRILLEEREITSLTERFLADIRRRTFGFVFQNYNLIRGLSVLENTMIPAYPDGEPYRRIRGRAKSLLERLHLGARAKQNVELLSGGEQQRTAIARALINDPLLVIADEPTAHLDSELAGEFLDIVADLKSEGRTILIASHDPVVCNAGIVDNVVALRDGRKVV